VIPLKDDNPTRRTPVVTIVVLLACLWIYFGWQPTLRSDDTRDVAVPGGVVRFDAETAFTLEQAAIPCELVEGEPLSLDEIEATFTSRAGTVPDGACGTGAASSPEVFADKSVWLSVLTSMFLHGSLLHLGGNLLFLWIFANNIEDRLGHVRFALFYLLGGIAATATHVVLNLDSTVPIVGASGAIAAVMGAYLVWFPTAPVRTLVFIVVFATIVRVPAVALLGFWFISQFFTSPNSGVAWAAHVGGFVFGVLVGLVVRTSGRVRGVVWNGGDLDPWRR
jgi:membrane associated rhomboid family serine protease